MAFEEYQLSLIAEVVDSVASPESSAGPLSKHCCVRMLIMLFSDEYLFRRVRHRIRETGGRVTPQQLDAVETNAKSAFWRKFTSDFNTNRTDFNSLHSADGRLAGLNPSKIVKHTRLQLFDAWKAIP